MGIASVSIVSSQNPCLFGYTPPSQCQECFFNDCIKWCSESPELDLESLNGYGPCDCSIRSFFECQKRWFHPYWMEIYDGNVKGCYARDLLCINDLVENQYYPEDACNKICADVEHYDECMDGCFDSATCYLYREPLHIEYPLQQIDPKGGTNPPLIIKVPSCNDSRTFFQSPPPCGRVFETDTSDEDFINKEVQILNDIEPIIIEGCCFDMRGCGSNPSLECATNCSGYNMPANYKCDVNEYVIMKLIYGGGVKINGIPYDSCTQDVSAALNGYTCTNYIVWYNGERPFDPTPGVVMIQGVPRTITIEGDGYLEFSLEQKCCYDCKPKPSLPATILYPKVDIETFSVPGGTTVIQDGKILSSFEMSPGSQQVFLQVENRGFFTQNDTRLRFDGLPEGVTVQTVPETQKLKAHNIGAYSALFTLGSNVPSGTYKVTMVAYSSSGVFDTATIDFVVP